MAGNISDVSQSLRRLVYISLGLLLVSALTGIAIVVYLFLNQEHALTIYQQLKLGLL